MGLDIFLFHESKQEHQDLDDSSSSGQTNHIIFPSEKHHGREVGYIRSNYNKWGFGIVLCERTGRTLEWIFSISEPHNYKDRVKIDWTATRQRAQQALEDFQAYLNKMGPYDIIDLFYQPYSTSDEIDSLQKATQFFCAERDRHEAETPEHRSNDYYRGKGEYSWGGLELVATIEGQRNGVPGRYGVIRLQKPRYQYVLDQLEVIIEMCDWIESQPCPDSYFLVWSP